MAVNSKDGGRKEEKREGGEREREEKMKKLKGGVVTASKYISHFCMIMQTIQCACT